MAEESQPQLKNKPAERVNTPENTMMVEDQVQTEDIPSPLSRGQVHQIVDELVYDLNCARVSKQLIQVLL